jgi:CubicO group peptidase (beta-lactamase class C family)
MILLRSFQISVVLRRTAAVVAVSLLVLFGLRPSAQNLGLNPFQNLTFTVFERYLDSLRLQAAIPGMSALILQDGVVVWERGFGRADIERAIDATPLTPYQIGGLSQAIGSTLLLKECIDFRAGTLNEAIGVWNPFAPDPAASLGQLIGYVSQTGAYKYDAARFATVTPAIEACGAMPYQRLVAEEIFSPLGLLDSVPGTALATPTLDDIQQFGLTTLARYAFTLGRAAKGYRIDTRGRATRTDVPPSRANAATGLVSTVRDLAKFDAGLRFNTLLRPETLPQAWTPVAPGFPTGLGWFVQGYNGIPVVWQFGVVPNAYSSLILKLPTRGLTLILLANSDGLSPPLALEKGDVTASVFARTFLRVYVP